MINNNYINSLANLAPWNMTTVIRTHYLLKPHVMDRKVNRMTKSSKIKNVFYVLENDYEIGLQEKSSAGHNPNKNNILGSQGFEAKMRSVMMLTKDAKDSSLRHLCVVKNNYIDEANKNSSYVLKFNNHLSFENTRDRVILDELGEEDYIGYARKLKEEGKTLREIEEKLREEGYEVSKSSIQRKI